MNIRELAAAFNTSISKIHRAIYRKGSFKGLKPILVNRRYVFDDEQVKRNVVMLQYLDEYYTTREVVNKFGIKMQTVKNRMVLYGHFRGVKPIKVSCVRRLLWDKKEIDSITINK